jgi:hypothetical protein
MDGRNVGCGGRVCLEWWKFKSAERFGKRDCYIEKAASCGCLGLRLTGLNSPVLRCGSSAGCVVASSGVANVVPVIPKLSSAFRWRWWVIANAGLTNTKFQSKRIGVNCFTADVCIYAESSHVGYNKSLGIHHGVVFSACSHHTTLV